VLNVELNGRAPTPEELYRIAATNYGHFTTMQVRGGRVRGMALHLARLDDGNETFFGGRGDVEDELRLRGWIRQALGDVRDASVRVTCVEAGVLVAVADPAGDEPRPPLRVRTQVYERPWPEQKHVATMGLWHAQRTAVAAGLDDALFLGPDGLVREGSVWNVAFWDGTQVVFPQAPMLKGVTMVLLQIALTMQGVPWTMRPVPMSELLDFTAAVAVNSRTVRQEITSIDDLSYSAGDKLAELMAEAYESVPFDAL
jgi:branched-subunit amino acid aminotransferase/4-amino-4-deoxychorismate lyase